MRESFIGPLLVYVTSSSSLSSVASCRHLPRLDPPSPSSMKLCAMLMPIVNLRFSPCHYFEAIYENTSIRLIILCFFYRCQFSSVVMRPSINLFYWSRRLVILLPKNTHNYVACCLCPWPDPGQGVLGMGVHRKHE
jgi:hypothetical protein